MGIRFTIPMKSYIYILSAVLLMSACDVNNASKTDQNIPDNVENDLLTQLRNTKDFQSFDFSKDEDVARFRELESTILEKWNNEATEKLLNSPIVWSQTTEWLVRNKNTEKPSQTSSEPDDFAVSMFIENSVTIPIGTTATGAGFRCTKDDLTNSKLFYRELDENGAISSKESEMKENVSAIEFELSLTSQISPSLNWVAVGFGFRSHENDIKTVRVYYAPYNPATRLIELSSVNDIINLSIHNNQFEYSNSGAIEKYLRTFDNQNISLSQLRKTHVIGVGGRVHKSNASRIALKLATIAE